MTLKKSKKIGINLQENIKEEAGPNLIQEIKEDIRILEEGQEVDHMEKETDIHTKIEVIEIIIIKEEMKEIIR